MKRHNKNKFPEKKGIKRSYKKKGGIESGLDEKYLKFDRSQL